MGNLIHFLSFITLVIVIISLVFNKRYLFYILFGLVLFLLSYLYLNENKYEIKAQNKYKFYLIDDNYAIENYETELITIYSADSIEIDSGIFINKNNFLVKQEKISLLREMAYFQIVLVFIYLIFFSNKDYITIRDYLKR